MAAGALTHVTQSLRRTLSDPRERRIVAAQAGWILAKAVSLATLVVTVPWTFHHLGSERFGLWMTLTSLAVVMGAGDLGIGSGAMTLIARATAVGDSAELRRILSNSVAALIGLWCGLSLLFLLIEPHIDWAGLFNLQSPAAIAEARPAARSFVLLALAAIPASLGQRIFSGRQNGLLNGLWLSASSIAALLALLAGISAGLALPDLIVCFIGAPVAVSAAATFHALMLGGPDERPSMHAVSRSGVTALFGSGLRYLAIFLIFSISFATDTIIVARMLGPEAVAHYSIADRLFQLLAVGLALINAPLWPAYAGAAARGDNDWIRERFKRALRSNLILAGGAALVLIVAAGPIFSIWIGSSLVPPVTLAVAIAARRVAEALYSACTMLLNALDVTWFQIGWGAAMAAATLALRIGLTREMGMIGVPIGVLLSVIAFSFVPIAFKLRRILAMPSARLQSRSSR